MDQATIELVASYLAVVAAASTFLLPKQIFLISVSLLQERLQLSRLYTPKIRIDNLRILGGLILPLICFNFLTLCQQRDYALVHRNKIILYNLTYSKDYV